MFLEVYRRQKLIVNLSRNRTPPSLSLDLLLHDEQRYVRSENNLLGNLIPICSLIQVTEFLTSLIR